MKVKKPENNTMNLLLEKLAINNLESQEEMQLLKEEFKKQERRISSNAKMIDECKKLSKEMVISSYERDERKKNEITENEITTIKVSIENLTQTQFGPKPNLTLAKFEEEKQRLTKSLELLETLLSHREELIKNYRSTVTCIQKVNDVTAQISKNSAVKDKKLLKKKNLKKKPSFESQLKAGDYHKKKITLKKKVMSARARKTGVDAGTVESDQATLTVTTDAATNITDSATNITDAAVNITDAEKIPIAAGAVAVVNNDNFSRQSESNVAANPISFPDVIVIEDDVVTDAAIVPGTSAITRAADVTDPSAVTDTSYVTHVTTVTNSLDVTDTGFTATDHDVVVDYNDGETEKEATRDSNVYDSGAVNEAETELTAKNASADDEGKKRSTLPKVPKVTKDNQTPPKNAELGDQMSPKVTEETQTPPKNTITVNGEVQQTIHQTPCPMGKDHQITAQITVILINQVAQVFNRNHTISKNSRAPPTSQVRGLIEEGLTTIKVGQGAQEDSQDHL